MFISKITMRYEMPNMNCTLFSQFDGSIFTLNADININLLSAFSY